MKLLKLCSALIIVVSLNANEIKPFGKFEFRDSISQVTKKLCDMKNIKNITLRGFGHKEYGHLHFCFFRKTIINKYIEESRKTDTLLTSNKDFGNPIVTMHKAKRFEISADGFYLDGIEFNLRLYLADYRDDALSAYLMTKDDTLTINIKNDYYRSKETNVLFPLILSEVYLSPKNRDIYNSNRKIIYDILKNKYVPLFGSKVKINDKHNVLSSQS
jgi:hypothetical protein